jgi:uncharacterized spore protein YtfJ
LADAITKITHRSGLQIARDVRSSRAGGVVQMKVLPASFQSLIEHLRSSAGVATVYGAPVEAHGRTLIPVARVAYGFGGGHGSAPGESPGGGESASGGGLGGGVSARPVGVVEIGPEGTRLIVFEDRKKLLASMAAAFFLGVLLGRRLSRRT